MSETAVNGVEPIIFLDDVHVTFRTRTGSILHPNWFTPSRVRQSLPLRYSGQTLRRAELTKCSSFLQAL